MRDPHYVVRRVALVFSAGSVLGGVPSAAAQVPVHAPAGTFDTAAPSPRMLIEQAVAGGTLTQEQGLLYQLFAMTGDERLPSRYRSTSKENGPADDSVIREVAQVFPTWSAAARSAAAPYFQPPIYPGSWYELREGVPSQANAADGVDPRHPGPEPLPREGWKTIASQVIPTRLWYLAEDPRLGPKAVFLSRQIEKAWPMLTKVMGRAPISDAGTHPFVQTEGSTKGAFDAWGDGGDGRFDIYLLPLPGWQTGGAITMAYPPGCSERPAFMMVDSRVDDRTLAAAAVHEFMHAIEFAFKVGADCGAGWDEATAHWALNYVLPDNNYEHMTRSCLQWPGGSCDSYGAWVFALYLERIHGPEVIRRSWDLMARYPAWKAVNAAVPGGLKKAWPEFARHGWNQPPFPTYEEWDAFLAKPWSPGYDNGAVDAALDERQQRFPDEENPRALQERETRMLPTPVREELRLDGKARKKIDVLDEVSNPLSRNYLRYSLPDEKVRYLRIKHPYKAGGPLSIQALRKRPDSSWVTEDWTASSGATICRDEKDEDLVELVLVIGNATTEGKPLARIPNVPGTGRWPSTGRASIELRGICPQSYRVNFVQKRVSEKRGPQLDATYQAVLRQLDEPDEDGNDFAGTGSYSVVSVDRKANCKNTMPEDERKTQGTGKLKAGATVSIVDGNAWVVFALTPVSGPKLKLFTRSFEGMNQALQQESDMNDDEMSFLAPVAISGVEVIGGKGKRNGESGVGPTECEGTITTTSTATVTRLR